MSQIPTNQAYPTKKPVLLSRKTFSTLGLFQQIAALSLEEVGDLKIIDSPDRGKWGDLI
jgi:hypothetical protein